VREEGSEGGTQDSHSSKVSILVTNLSARSESDVELTSSDTVSVPALAAREKESERCKAAVTSMSAYIARASKEAGEATAGKTHPRSPWPCRSPSPSGAL
jgi:hypothetical protein